MSANSARHLNALKEILKAKEQGILFLCISDLVANGLTLARFAEGERKPSRQDITQFILAWLKYIGVSAEECENWMIEYCLDMLSVISSSSKSQIRHSTKSNIKYIYRSDVTFDCSCENNAFKAPCDAACPVYKEMFEKYKERLVRAANKTYEIVREPTEQKVIFQPISVKEQFRDQFEKALEVIGDFIKQGIAIKNIVKLLNDSELKTRTGKKWTYAVLQTELKRHPEIIAMAPEKKVRKKPLSVKKQYRDQFEKALDLIDNCVKQGIDRKQMVKLLNEHELKTKTGRKWTIPILKSELKRQNK